MSRFCTTAAIVALLAGFFEAPYFHLHGNPASDHVRKHHHGKGLALHSHFSIPQHRAEHSSAAPSSAENADNDAIFAAQASSLTRLFLLPVFLPEDTIQLNLLDRVWNLVGLPAHHAHDPPLGSSISARPPPA